MNSPLINNNVKDLIVSLLLANSQVAFTAYSVVDATYNQGDLVQFPEVISNYMDGYDASEGEDSSYLVTMP